MISPNDIKEVLDRANLVDVITNVAPNLKIKVPASGKGVCSCPFHEDRSPSFSFNNNSGVWRCFSCQRKGNVFQFVQQYEGCDFPTSVKRVGEICGYRVEETKRELTAEEQKAYQKRESMLIINKHVTEFFANALWANDAEAQDAREYIKSRKWSEDFAKESDLGLARADGKSLYEFAKKKQLSIPLMIEMGLLKENESGDIYDVYRDRLMIPIKTRADIVEAFTARLLHESEHRARCEAQGKKFKSPKYINSRECECYSKSKSIFGIHKAVNKAASEGIMYLVEGAPDVMRLHSIDIFNAIASLGGAWTDEQLKQLKGYNFKLCFIPDCDPPKDGEEFGAGTQIVMANGVKATNLGLEVKVKEIEPTDEKEKQDPDSLIHSKKVLDAIPEEDFILWYARKKIKQGMTSSDIADKIDEIAKLVAKVPSATNASVIEAALGKRIGYKKEWHKAITEAKRTQKEEQKRKRSKSIDRDTLTKYGFYEDQNCYYSVGNGGTDLQWSNFIMKPLFHIEDSLMPKRLFNIVNINGVDKIIELKQADLTSLSRFSERVEGMGNFIWLAKQEQLNKLKMYLYEQTETATEVTQLGWQQKGFWAFGNGVYHNGEWIEADELGIVRLEGIGNFYLPAFSKIYRGETKLFQFERQFILTQYNSITMRSYTDKLISVFGNNAKVGICFLLATLFKDVIVAVTKNFPILNFFGQKGSGKSEMAHTLMSFFVANNTPPNLQNATDASLADAVAQCANALVHLDEYKNTIDLTRREFLKGLYDGTGRSRMNMDRDKKREMTSVDCGVIVSGQEMPTIDNALFSRLIYLTFDTSMFSAAAKKKFDELTEIRRMGCSHLTLEIMKHRKRFEVDFPSNYRATLNDVVSALEKDNIEDRILRSWVIPLSAFRTLSGVIDLQFDYKEMLKITIAGIIKQNAECRSNNELSQFWNAVEVMHQQGIAVSNADFRIVYETSLQTRVNGKAAKQEWRDRRAILYINFKVLLSSYTKYARGKGDTIVPENTLRNYLEVSPEYLGLKTAVRFQMPNNQHEGTRSVVRDGHTITQRTAKNYQAYCFDYDAISDKYGINLQLLSSSDMIDSKDIDSSDTDVPF